MPRKGILHYMMYRKPSFRPPLTRPEEKHARAISSAALESVFARCADFETRRLRVGADGGTEVFVCWLDGLISSFETAEELLRPLTDPRRVSAADAAACFAALSGGALSCPSLGEPDSLDALCAELTHGRCALVFDSLGDHRLAMTWSLVGLTGNVPIKVAGFDSVDVSYPDFLRDIEELVR